MRDYFSQERFGFLCRFSKVPTIIRLLFAALLLAGSGAQAQPRDVDIGLTSGLNLFSYPVTVPAELSCADMQAILSAAVLTRLDAQSQQFETCNPLGTNFPIEPGAGYLVEMADSGQFTLSGEPACPQLDLSPGLNLVGVPTPPPGLSCYPSRANCAVRNPLSCRVFSGA